MKQSVEPKFQVSLANLVTWVSIKLSELQLLQL